MFWYATGAIAAPAFASLLIDLYGPAALFGMIAVGHLGLVVFGLLRMRARPYQTKKPPMSMHRARPLQLVGCYAVCGITRTSLFPP